MEGLDRSTVPAPAPNGRRPWFVDWIWVAYLFWVLPHFAATYWPRITHWLRMAHPG